MRVFALFAMLLACSLAAPAHAGPKSEALGQCLVKSSTTQDQLVLVRWMFSAMVQHPELKELSRLDDAQREKIDADVAASIQRLITRDCRPQARAVIQEEGMIAFQSAFEVFGRVAAQSIFGHPAVNAAMGGLDKHFDSKEMAKALMSDEQ